jgi:hypothetical protein
LEDDDSVHVRFATPESQATEGATPGPEHEIEVILSGSQTVQTVEVPYSVTPITATLGEDFDMPDGTLVFTPGQISKTITPLHFGGGTVREPDETFEIRLNEPINAPLGSPSVHTVTIVDDGDLPEVEFAAPGDSVAEAETIYEIPVKLSAVHVDDVTVLYSVTGGTATPGSGGDYELASGSLLIAAEEPEGSIALVVHDDNIDEEVETIVVSLSDPSNSALGAISTFTRSPSPQTDRRALKMDHRSPSPPP